MAWKIRTAIFCNLPENSSRNGQKRYENGEDHHDFHRIAGVSRRSWSVCRTGTAGPMIL